MSYWPFWGSEDDWLELGFAITDEPSSIEHRIAAANGLTYGCPPRHWKWKGPLAAVGVEKEEATHMNYKTGELCYCDAPFFFLPGPCVDEEPMVDGSDPVNGTG